jgi:hypothetical protein
VWHLVPTEIIPLRKSGFSHGLGSKVAISGLDRYKLARTFDSLSGGKASLASLDNKRLQLCSRSVQALPAEQERNFRS